jgi:hypothetical protein
MRKKMIRGYRWRHPGDASRRYQTRHRAMGLCSVCPRPLAEGSKVYCNWHREKNRQRKRRLRGPIFCRKCRKPLAESQRRPGRRYHPRCLQALRVEREQSRHYRQLHADAARAYQLRHVALGLCTQCPQPVVAGKNVCERHLRYRQERYRRLKGLSKSQEGRVRGEASSGQSEHGSEGGRHL